MIETLLPGLLALQNVHPLFVHFPIAFFLGAFAMEVLAILRHEKYHIVATGLLYLGALSAVAAATTGLIAEYQVAAVSGGHHTPSHGAIHIHKAWMVSATVVGVFLSIYLFWINKTGRWLSQRFVFLLGLMLLSAIVVLGADRGARLVFEFGTGVNPEILKSITEQDNPSPGH